MFDQPYWRGVAALPWTYRSPTDRALGEREIGRKPAWPSVRRVGLRLATLGSVALLCALSGTAVFDGRADSLKGPQPVVWIAPEQGMAPWLVE